MKNSHRLRPIEKQQQQQQQLVLLTWRESMISGLGEPVQVELQAWDRIRKQPRESFEGRRSPPLSYCSARIAELSGAIRWQKDLRVKEDDILRARKQ